MEDGLAVIHLQKKQVQICLFLLKIMELKTKIILVVIYSGG